MGMFTVVPSDFRELRLMWPPDLFQAVAMEVAPAKIITRPALQLLVLEAMVDSRGLEADVLYGGRPASGDFGGFWAAAAATAEQHLVNQRFSELVAAIATGAVLPFSAPSYYRARSAPRAPQTPLSGPTLGAELCQVFADMDDRGYFDEAFGLSCCDMREDRPGAARALFVQRLGEQTSWQWPAVFDGQDLEDVYDLVEVCHDLVARPRVRQYHQFCDEWDYSEFQRRAGRLVYRWRINSVLQRSSVELRMSDTGEDEGRLVHAPGDPRNTLPGRVVAAAKNRTEQERLQHAIAVFRGRHADRNAKRDAVRALGDVLELRRTRVRKVLGRKDEDALFDILNNFDIRHLNRTTQADYDEAFLDWIFWTLLASLAFMDAKEGVPSPAPTRVDAIGPDDLPDI